VMIPEIPTRQGVSRNSTHTSCQSMPLLRFYDRHDPPRGLGRPAMIDRRLGEPPYHALDVAAPFELSAARAPKRRSGPSQTFAGSYLRFSTACGLEESAEILVVASGVGGFIGW
jgi:hypothetical protein